MLKCKTMFVIAGAVALLAAPLSGFADTYRITAIWEMISIPGSSESQYVAEEAMQMLSERPGNETLLDQAVSYAQIAALGMLISVPVEIEMTLAEDGSLNGYRIEHPMPLIRTDVKDFSPQYPLVEHHEMVLIEWTPEERIVTRTSLDSVEKSEPRVSSEDSGTVVETCVKALQWYHNFLSEDNAPVSETNGVYQYETDNLTFQLSVDKKWWKAVQKNVSGYSTELELMEIDPTRVVLLPRMVETRTPDLLARLVVQEVRPLRND